MIQWRFRLSWNRASSRSQQARVHACRSSDQRGQARCLSTTISSTCPKEEKAGSSSLRSTATLPPGKSDIHAILTPPFGLPTNPWCRIALHLCVRGRLGFWVESFEPASCVLGKAPAVFGNHGRVDHSGALANGTLDGRNHLSHGLASILSLVVVQCEHRAAACLSCLTAIAFTCAQAEMLSDQIVTRAQGKQGDSRVPRGTEVRRRLGCL